MKFYRYASLIEQVLVLAYQAVHQWIYYEWLAQRFPTKPIVLQFPVNDICNSRCIMCNVWQCKRDKEITPEELRHILADPLFKEIRYAGISGGEPTLRSDLSDIGKTLINSLPKLQGIGIITNALRPRMVIDRTLGLAQVAQNSGLSFNVGVSLDGIGDVHDQNRGVKGNFASAIEVINELKTRGTPVSIGCTLTPLNCYWADDVLIWCENNDIKFWEFRLGVEIKRLYNEGFSVRHQFTPEQHFHLVMFFDKLARHPKVDAPHRRFYRSLVGQLAFGLPRQAGCDWRARGVTLDARGNISYCSVRSPILGSALTKSAWQLFKGGSPERQRIIREHCDSCQHDLLGPPSPKELVGEVMELWQQRWRGLRTYHNPFAASYKAPKSISSATHDSPSEWQHVLISGWYGTETAGDKAILGELLHFLKTNSPKCRVTLTTLDRKVSQQTKLELPELKDITLVDMDKSYDPALIESVDAVIIGGGPLEEIAQTEYIWRMFVEANRQRRARIIFGCGIGPLYSDRLRRMVGAICQMTTAGFLRDQESLEYAFKLGATVPLGCACDPSLAYVRRWAANRNLMSQVKESPYIAGLVRANTNEYISDMHGSELDNFNARTALQIAQILETVCKARQAKVTLLPMHTIWLGGDDRIFNRQVAAFFQNTGNVCVERRYLPPNDLLHSICRAEAAMAMRYHGHLFCMALGIPFLSIDYTEKPGKVCSLIERIGYEQWSEEWRDINIQRAASRLRQLIDEHSHWSVYLQQYSDKLIAELRQTYTKVFGVPEVIL